MNARNFSMRIGPFILALTLGLLNWNASPVSSQPEMEGMPVHAPRNESWQEVLRLPSGWPARTADYNVFFTRDVAAGLGIAIWEVQVHDKWTWRYYDPSGALYSDSCFIEVRGPGEPGNDSMFIALVTNCPTNPEDEWEALEYFIGDCPCTSWSFWAIGLPVDFHPAASRLGAWTTFVDYTNPEGNTTPAWAQDTMYLTGTPAVILIPGYEEECYIPDLDFGVASDYEPSNMYTLERSIEEELGVSDERVVCYEYDSEKGVALAAKGLASFIEGFRAGLLMKPEEEVDLVGHSMGGLVARYYTQRPLCSTEIGSVSMLGTPNEGVWLAKMEKWLCPAAAAILGPLSGIACGVVDWLDLEQMALGGFDPDSQGVTDVAPGSDILHELNDDFVLPEPPDLPEYRAHAGLDSSNMGFVTSGNRINDCLVSLDSVNGLNGVFGGERLFTYEPLTHGAEGWPGCESPTLLNDLSVVQDLAATIKGGAGGGALAAEPLAQADQEGSVEAALAETTVDFVQPSQSKTHQISVPSGLETATFITFWLDNYPRPELGFTLRRPDETVVSESDPDVVEQIAVTGDSPFYVLMQGFAMSAPVAGDWEVTVEGLSVPEQGQVYVVALMPDSQVVLSSNVSGPYIPQGQSQLITAELFDSATAIAVTDISAEVTTPAGDEMAVTLRDDGTGGDQVAGDLTYSGSFTSTADCGGYGVYATATADSSEGTVTREQVGFFQAHLPGDAIRDPCNADEDEDGLTDADEINVVGTDPMEPDTDFDEMPDGYEHAHTCLNPLGYDSDADPDGDGLDSLTEYNRGSNPCSADAVGGIAEFPSLEPDAAPSGSNSSMPNTIALAGAVAGSAVLLVAGGWYARRRRRV